MNSWGVYLASAFALVLIMSPQLSRLTSESRESSDFRNLDGVRAVLDELQHGERAVVSFGSWIGGDPIRLRVTQISCDYGSGVVSMDVRWQLPDATLYPGVNYVIELSGSTVGVTQAV